MFNALKMVVVQPLLGLIDCASINFGLIRHYEHNFHLSSEKSTASIICSFGWFCSSKLSFFDRATNLFWSEISFDSVAGKFKQQINFLPAYFYIHETWVPQKMTHNSLQRTQRIRITSSLTQDGVRKLVAIF